LDNKNAIKQENRGPPPRFLTTPSTPSKEFENGYASTDSKRIVKKTLSKEKKKKRNLEIYIRAVIKIKISYYSLSTKPNLA
jgi:hypothetical protein